MTSSPNPAVVDGINVDTVASAVSACAGVSALYGGRISEVASYLPGRRVSGVVVDPDALTIQVRARWGVPAADVFDQINAVLAPLHVGRPINVVVADIDDPPSLDGSVPRALPAPPTGM